MPVTPASPQNRAYSDHPYAASVPTETRVSIVVAPWRALTQAARWNGSAPQTTTGDASVSESHCQLSNCQAGTIASRITGMLSSAETTSRSRNGSVGAESGAGASEDGTAAPYPADSTAATRSSVLTDAGNSTRAVSVA